jgi:6-phosphogluconolactonase
MSSDIGWCECKINRLNYTFIHKRCKNRAILFFLSLWQPIYPIEPMKTRRILFFLSLALLSIAACKPGTRPAEIAGSDDSLKQDSVIILYVGTYTEKEDFVGGKATGIYVYELNTNSGGLTYVSSSPQTVNPSYLVADNENKILYAVNETGGGENQVGSISAFRLLNGGRQIDLINTVSSQGSYPCYVSLDKTRKWVMCANYGSGTVAVMPVRDSGSLGEATMVHQHAGKGPSPRQDAAHAHFIFQNPSNSLIYSCDLGLDTIYIYKLDTTTGKLIHTGHNYATMPGAGPRHLAFHPSMNLAYVVNELNGTIEVMKVDSVTGALRRIQVISTLDPGMKTDASCADIHLTPSGKFLYASNRAKVNNLAIYQVDQQTGKLTLVGHQPVKGKTPRNFIVDPTGRFLLVANQDTGNVVTFRIDQETGKLEDTGIETIIPSPVCLKFLL